MGAHIGHRRCHATFRQHSIAFRGLTALFGHMGLELDPVAADAKESDGYRRYALLYKEWRQLIHTGVLACGYARSFDTGSGSRQP